MARSNKVRAKDLQGLAIHHGDKQTFLLDWFDGTPRVLDDDDAKQYSLWQMRMPAAILIGCIAFSYSSNVPISFLVGVGIYVLATVVYLFKFVKNLPEAKKFVKEEKDPLPVRLSKNLSMTRLIISMIMLIALTVLLPIFGKTEHYEGFYLIFTYLLAAATAVLAVMNFWAILIKRKNEK